MGREIKRVPVDFEWPLNEVWGGFLKPDELHPQECHACKGEFMTDAGRIVMHLAQMINLLDGDFLISQQRGQSMHPYIASMQQYTGVRPSADIVQFVEGMAGRSGSFFGHDAIDRWSTYHALLKAAGLDEKWGMCPTCHGEGYVYASDEQKAKSEAWTETPVPTGEAYQLWETVSEGSPISPVFATAEDLATWIIDNGHSQGSFESVLAWVTEGGWAPSMVLTNGSLKTGIDAGLK